MDPAESRRVADPQLFRLRMRGPLNWPSSEEQANGELRAVAMFVDRRSAPSLVNVERALRTASAESGFPGAGEKRIRLCVILLRNDGRETLTLQVSNFMDEFAKSTNRQAWIEVWSTDRLQYNVLDLGEVPRHTRVPSAPVRGAPEALPLILTKDPVAKALGLVPGEIVRIDRVDTRLGPSVYYRRAVEQETKK